MSDGKDSIYSAVGFLLLLSLNLWGIFHRIGAERRGLAGCRIICEGVSSSHKMGSMGNLSIAVAIFQTQELLLPVSYAWLPSRPPNVPLQLRLVQRHVRCLDPLATQGFSSISKSTDSCRHQTGQAYPLLCQVRRLTNSLMKSRRLDGYPTGLVTNLRHICQISTDVSNLFTLPWTTSLA